MGAVTIPKPRYQRTLLTDDMIDRNATEQILIEKAREGDREAFARLVEPYRGKLESYIRGRVGDADMAQSLTQSAMIEAYRAISGFRSECPFDRWLWKIATRVLIRHYRSEAGRRWTSLDDLSETCDFEDEDDATDQVENHRWMADLVEVAKSICTEVQLAVILMFARTGSFDETAHLLNMKPATCRSHFLRGRSLLMAELIVNRPTLVGGSAAIRAVVAKLREIGPPEGLTEPEVDAYRAQRVRSAQCQAACLKVARELPNPLSSWSH